MPKGTLVIRAAELIGVEIPRFCDHPLLDPVGACRQCLVEVPDAGNGRPIPKPQASCTLEVAPGMKIKTQVTSPVADKAQHGNMEFLLINHPLDCPICDKGGECPLQNQAMSHGYAETRFTDVKRTYPKPINISANVLLDRERCVLCARCTRFSEQIAGDPFIALIERGALQQVGIYEREPLESYFSGNTIQICPVGALTSRGVPVPLPARSTWSPYPIDRRARRLRLGHPGRPPARSGDAPAGRRRPRGQRGVDHRQGPVRASPTGGGDDRLTRPLVRDSTADVLRPASWPEAIDVAVRGSRRRGRRPTPGGGGREPGSRVGCADRRPAHPGGRVRLRASSPGPCSAPTTSTSAPGRTPARRPSSWPTPWPAPGTGVSYADLETRRPGAAGLPSSRRRRPARSSCGCARRSARRACGPGPSRRT